MTPRILVTVTVDRSSSPCWSIKVGDTWAELSVWQGGADAPDLRPARRALGAVGVPEDAQVRFECCGPWLAPPAREGLLRELKLAWGAAGGSGEGKARAELDPGGSVRDAMILERAESRPGPPADAPRDPPERPQEAKAAPDKKAGGRPAESGSEGPPVLFGRRSRKRAARMAPTEPSALVEEMVQLLSVRLSQGGGAPSFADERSKLSAYNYIRSTSGQVNANDRVVEAVRARLADLARP